MKKIHTRIAASTKWTFARIPRTIPRQDEHDPGEQE